MAVDPAKLAALYQEYLGRAPEAGAGSAYGTGQQALDGILSSQEYQQRKASATVDATNQQALAKQQAGVTQAQGLLGQVYGRPATDNEASYWGGLLGSQPRSMVMRQLSQTPEGKAAIMKGYEMPWYDPNAYMRQARAQQAPVSQQDALEELFRKYMGQQRQSPWSIMGSDGGSDGANGGTGGPAGGDGSGPGGFG